MLDFRFSSRSLKLGVAKEDIVLGLHPPYKHPYTGYGVA
ncbi:MAG TPA: XisI protein [Oscillatoriales cyanobacterium M59_W2019_021]|nr:MAG: hypothetical protein D6728_08335 [Cyanobacteria bacterium J055]HIK31418.1 XisI protein [Oscillatoriales cyanobacterium M4454_W2019_049]HIK50084.1 XisI protein [Oscillatoriales cyanobacterium M59_W2019_021]